MGLSSKKNSDLIKTDRYVESCVWMDGWIEESFLSSLWSNKKLPTNFE